MKLLNLFNKKVPWENRKPIYMHIKENIDKDGKLTTESLPDDEIRYKDTDYIILLISLCKVLINTKERAKLLYYHH